MAFLDFLKKGQQSTVSVAKQTVTSMHNFIMHSSLPGLLDKLRATAAGIQHNSENDSTQLLKLDSALQNIHDNVIHESYANKDNIKLAETTPEIGLTMKRNDDYELVSTIAAKADTTTLAPTQAGDEATPTPGPSN